MNALGELAHVIPMHTVLIHTALIRAYVTMGGRVMVPSVKTSMSVSIGLLVVILEQIVQTPKEATYVNAQKDMKETESSV